MKILMITDLYPIKADENNIPKTLYNFVQSWICQGHQVDVIRPNFVPGSLFAGNPISPSGWYGNVYNVNYLTPFLFNVKNKLKDIDLESYDKIFAHLPAGEIFALHLGVDFVAGVHSADFELLSNPICKLYFKGELEKAHKKAIQVACRSYDLKEKFIKRYPMYIHKTFVALSGIDADTRKPETVRQKPRYMDGIKSEHKRALTCAVNRKNLEQFVEVCKNVDGLDLTIIGDTVEKQKLMRMSSDVVFLGKLSQDRVFERMRASDIFILPPATENIAQICLEAMACGCVVVAIKGEGVDWLIENGKNGFLCDFAELESLLGKIVKNEDLKEIAENAVETAKRYTNETCAKSYLDGAEL